MCSPILLLWKSNVGNHKKSIRGRPATPAPILRALDISSDEPIERKVYSAIRYSLMSGNIMPGAKLSSRSIAEALGVSATPVREALKRLEADGIMEGVFKSGFTVKPLTRDEYHEIFDIRLVLEPMLGRKAAGRVSDVDIKRATWLHDRMTATTNWRQYLDYNYQMHFLVYRAAQQPHTLSLVENVWLKLGPTLNTIYANEAITASEYASTASEHHAALLRGLIERSPDLVEKALLADIRDAVSVADIRLQ